MIFGRKNRKPIAIPAKDVADWKYTTCNYCSTGCAIEIGLNDEGRIVTSRGHAGADVNRGKLCIKGLLEHELFESPGRGRFPLLRDAANATSLRDLFIADTTGTATINEGGVVNNAAYTQAASAVAPGSLVAVFGSNFTDGRTCLPPACGPTLTPERRIASVMAGTQVLVNGNPAPLQASDIVYLYNKADLTGGVPNFGATPIATPLAEKMP